MSNLNHYAKKIDEMAKGVFDEYRQAEKSYQDAERKAKNYPQRAGMVTAEYAAQSARAQADYAEAKAALSSAKAKLNAVNNDIRELRGKLATDIDSEYGANPAQLDAATLELLKSGVLNASEYKRLLDAAQAENNHTMARLIGKYAGDAAKIEKDDDQARTLRLVEYDGKQSEGNAVLKAFDQLAYIYSRCADNTAMIDHWDELTQEAITNF